MNVAMLDFIKTINWWRYLKIIMVTACALIVVHIILFFFDAYLPENIFTITRDLVLSAILIESIQFINRRIDRKVTWRENPLKRFILQFTFDVSFVLFICIFLKLLVFIFILHINIRPGKELNEQIAISVTIVIFTVLVVLFDLGIFLVRRWGFDVAELERTKREALQFSYEVLISQINPHFLFNSLNTLCALINDDPQQAIKFTRQLSGVFRNVLEVQEKEMVTVKDEFRMAESYISLMNIRFDQNLQIIFEEGLITEHRCIPGMTIQLLLENAVNHNIIAANQPLTIAIYREKDFLVVKNNLQPKDLRSNSTGIGLKNITARYRMIGNREINIEKTETHFIVKLPLIDCL